LPRLVHFVVGVGFFRAGRRVNSFLKGVLALASPVGERALLHTVGDAHGDLAAHDFVVVVIVVSGLGHIDAGVELHEALADLEASATRGCRVFTLVRERFAVGGKRWDGDELLVQS